MKGECRVSVGLIVLKVSGIFPIDTLNVNMEYAYKNLIHLYVV